MEKKIYIAPQVEVIETELVTMIATSPGDIPVVDGEGGEILSNRHRGEWGNLWTKDKE